MLSLYLVLFQLNLQDSDLLEELQNTQKEVGFGNPEL